MFRSRLILIAMVIECSLSGMVYAQLASQINNEKAKDLLDKMLATRNKMRNLQYEFETTCWYDLDLAKRHLDWSALPPKEGYDIDFGIISIVLDCTGRGKRELKQCGVVDSSGKKIPVETLMKISAWDGQTGVDYRYGHKVGYPGYAELDDSPPSYVKNFGHPWWVYTGTLVDDLANAIEEHKPVNVETLPDGKYKVSFIKNIINNITYEKVAVIDPGQGFSCTKQITTANGNVLGYRTAEYEEFIDGVWLPVTGEQVVNKEGAVLWKATEKMKDIKVNDPNFDEGLFHIDLPKGTSVTDKTLGIMYLVGDPTSIYTYPYGMSSHQVVMNELDEMAKETNQKHHELFVPKVGNALKNGAPFVLGLADRKLVNPRSKPESEEFNKFIAKLGKGDIAWDGSVVATRGAKVLTIKQESKRPLKLTEGKWTNSYKLPDKVQLPYSMLVVTNESMNYLMKIMKIDSGGITITYRELNPDELTLYKQESENN